MSSEVPAICEKCGASILETNAFCTKCGARRNASTDQVGARRLCTKCGSPLTVQTKFCTKCGAQVGGTPEPGPVMPNTEFPATKAGAFGSASDRSAGSRSIPTTARATAQPAPAGIKASARFPKMLLAGIVIVILVGMTVTASVIYVAHRIGQKAAEMRSASNTEKSVEHPRAGSDSSRTVNSSAAPAGKPTAPYGWTTDKDGKLVPAPSPVAPVSNVSSSAPSAPSAVTGDTAHDWALEYERTENGLEADLVVRTGDISNLGFGWPKGFDPFSGKSTFSHPFPWSPKPGSPDGTDRMLLGSAVTPADYVEHPVAGDGYSLSLLRPCITSPDVPICKNRQESMPQPIVLSVGALPAKITAVLFQIFVDDFQAPSFHSHFQASLNGTRIPSIEQALNAVDQTGPIGKLITVNLLPEYFPLLQSGTVKLLIDDPTTHAQDGYAVDFVRILVNPRKFQYLVSVAVTVKDWDKDVPIPGATVTASLQSAPTDASGKCELNGLPAGLVIATALAPGYDANSAAADVVAGQSGHAEIQLHRHEEGTSALEKAIAQTGSATIYGIHFDTNSAKLRSDSVPALRAVLGLVNNHPGSRWTIAGHTDNQGNASHNQTLSENRAASVITWLKQQSADSRRLEPLGFGPTRPVADNATPNGRALNRRVEVVLAK
jgi:OmpA-OmpF porin, OOP family